MPGSFLTGFPAASLATYIHYVHVIYNFNSSRLKGLCRHGDFPDVWCMNLILISELCQELNSSTEITKTGKIYNAAKNPE